MSCKFKCVVIFIKILASLLLSRTLWLQNLDKLLQKMAKRELVVEMLLDDGDMQTRGCKTLKHCQKRLEMLLEDDETKNSQDLEALLEDLVVAE